MPELPELAQCLLDPVVDGWTTWGQSYFSLERFSAKDCEEGNPMNETPADAEAAAVVWCESAGHEARRIVAGHPLFWGRVDAIEFYQCDEVLLVQGRVPSFYLKQVLQTVLRNVGEFTRIDNRVDVVCSDGLSSVRRR